MLTVTDMDTLARYGRGVLARAKHHGANIMRVLPDILGNTILRGTELELYGDGTKNAMFFTSVRTGRRYAMSYDHDAGAVQLKEGSLQGPVLQRINNSTGRERVAEIFEAL